MESRLGTLLLRTTDSYESLHATAPTVVELAADLGIPPDFGHSRLVGRLQRELSAGIVSHYRGRICLTAAGREMIECHTSPLLPPQQPAPRGEHTPSKASPA